MVAKHTGIISISVLFLALLLISCVPQGDLKQKVDINVIGGTNLVTTEGGSETSLLIYLSTAPTSDVTFPFESGDPTEILLGSDQLPADQQGKTVLLTFTPENWSSTQKLKLYGQDDKELDGNQDITVITHPALSSDVRYEGLDPGDYKVTNEDDDEAGILFSGITLTDISLTDLTLADLELGRLTLADIFLTDIKLTDATLTDGKLTDLALTDLSLGDLALADGSLGKRTLAHLTLEDITQANYALSDLTLTETALTKFDLKTLTLKDHVLKEIVLKNRILIDVAAYDIALNDIVMKDIVLTTIDNLSTSESGETTVFNATLNTKPKGNVEFDLIIQYASEGLLSLSSSVSSAVNELTMTFTEANWNVPQAINVFGQDDFRVDGDLRHAIITSLLRSSDSDYNDVEPLNVTVQNIDDDIASYTVCPSMPIEISEFEKVCNDKSSPLIISNEGVNTFYLYLDSMPAQYLEIPITSSDTQIGKLKLAGDTAVSKGSVSVEFPLSDWNTPQPVSIIRQGEASNDSVSEFSIIFHPVLTKDQKFQRIVQPDLEVINLGDAPGVFINPIKDLITSEDGQDAEFTIRLTSEPQSPVEFLLTSEKPEEGLLIGGDSANTEAAEIEIEFTPDNWSTQQLITVKGQNDDLEDGNQTYTIISQTVTSDDSDFGGLVPINPENIIVTNIDDDSPDFIFTPISSLETSDSGKIAQFSYSLTTQPDADVVVDVSVSDSSEGQLLKNLSNKHSFKLTMIFTPVNWSIPQVVYVTGIGDDILDGDQPNNISIAVNNTLTMDTTGYADVKSTITVTNIDDDY